MSDEGCQMLGNVLTFPMQHRNRRNDASELRADWYYKNTLLQSKKLNYLLISIICIPTEHICIPTECIFIPTERFFIPTECIFIPTERICIPTERICIPTERICIPTGCIFI